MISEFALLLVRGYLYWSEAKPKSNTAGRGTCNNKSNTETSCNNSFVN